jgi:hypothetical protein
MTFNMYCRNLFHCILNFFLFLYIHILKQRKSNNKESYISILLMLHISNIFQYLQIILLRCTSLFWKFLNRKIQTINKNNNKNLFI